jgi:hypothetical protein
MKKTIIFILSMVAFAGIKNPVSAQSSDNAGILSIATYIDPIVEEKTTGATSVLETKLGQIVSANGMGNGFSRFIITANVTVVTKDVLGTAPATYAYTLDLTLVIGDGIDGNAFARYPMTIKGVGNNETKALISALRTIDPRNKDLQEFVSNAKEQIIKYYSSRCDLIIKQARMLENQNQFDEAIYSLMSIPEASSCYTKGLEVVNEIYNQKVERECKIKLQEAKNLWNANPTVEGANKVAAILSEIDPRATCYKEVSAFATTVGKRVLELDGREWNFKVDKEIGLERDRIKAIRDIGVAWGQGQPKTVHYNIRGWW